MKFSDKLSSASDVVVHDPGGLEMKQVIACSPNTLNISCPEDHTIEIINGNFGRFTITLCNGKVKENNVVEENRREHEHFSESPELVGELLPGRGCCVYEGGVQWKEKLLHPV